MDRIRALFPVEDGKMRGWSLALWCIAMPIVEIVWGMATGMSLSLCYQYFYGSYYGPGFYAIAELIFGVCAYLLVNWEILFRGLQLFFGFWHLLYSFIWWFYAISFGFFGAGHKFGCQILYMLLYLFFPFVVAAAFYIYWLTFVNTGGIEGFRNMRNNALSRNNATPSSNTRNTGNVENGHY